jgi:hypothetical protein
LSQISVSSSIATIDPVAATTQAVGVGSSPAELIDRFPSGQVIRAEVIRILAENLFTLSIPGGTIQAKSDIPLSPGDQLLLEINRNAPAPGQNAGAPQFRLVSQNSTTALPTDGSSLRPVVNNAIANSADLRGAIVVPSARPGGAIDQLAQARPELAPRIEELLRLTDQRPGSLGDGILRLQQDVGRVANSLPRSATVSPDALTSIAGRTVQQLVNSSALSDPPQLAADLLRQYVSLARGFEAKLASADLPSRSSENSVSSPGLPVASESASTISPTASQTRPLTDSATEPPSENLPAPANRAASLLLSALAESNRSSALPGESSPGVISEKPVPLRADLPPAAPKETLAASKEVALSSRSSDPAASSRASVQDPSIPTEGSPNRTDSSGPTTVRGVLDGDLKGQLLELRGKLETVAVQTPSPGVTASIVRTDRLIDQLTSQQLRNVDGLNQYFSVALPIDPATGVSQAQLQAFYRRSSNGGVPTLDDTSRFTVALFLQLTQLGDVMATVTGVEGTVSVSLMAETPEASDRLTRSIDELRGGLAEVGQTGAMITVRPRPLPSEPTSAGEQAESLWDDFRMEAPLASTAGSRLNREA